MLNSTLKQANLRKKSTVSASPISKQRSKSISITTCKNIKFISELNEAQQQLAKNRDKMATCLDIYAILEGHQEQQRCLKHNNLLSLYCFNERKILCVNCIYGVNKHKTHKVIPLKDCMKEVQQDNSNLRKIMESQMQKLELHSKVSKDNKYILQTDLKESLNNLQINFQARQKQLEANYMAAKSQIQKIYEPIISKSQKLEKMFEQFRFRIWEALLRYGDKDSLAKDNIQISKHIFYISVLQLLEVKIRPISERQLQNLFRKAKISL